jgi:hypothetical protein
LAFEHRQIKAETRLGGSRFVPLSCITFNGHAEPHGGGWQAPDF